MTNNTRTADEIERAIVDERSRMSDTMDDIQKKFSVDTLLDDLGTMVRDRGGDLGRSIGRTAGQNPAAVALVGVGLAWMFLGNDRTGRSGANAQKAGQRSARARGRGMSGSPDDHAWSSGSQYEGDDHAWYGEPATSHDIRSQGKRFGGAPKAGEDGSDGSGGIKGKVRNGSDAVEGAISNAAGRTRDMASDLSDRLSHGLEDLSEGARSRVMAARRAAHEARLSSEAAMGRGKRAASDLMEEQPLVVGALALAAGAALGALLPRSDFENERMGDSSDRLFSEAQKVLREERDKAVATARTAAADVKDQVKEDAKDIGSDLANRLPEDKSAGDVVADHASDAAKRMKDRSTGKPENAKADGTSS